MVSEVVVEANDSDILVELVGHSVVHAMIGIEYLSRHFVSEPNLATFFEL